MDYRTVLITGGAGFIGTHLALHLKSTYPQTTVKVFDNLRRRGSELNLVSLKAMDIEFHHGDIRHENDLRQAGPFDLMIDCSAEPSVIGDFKNGPLDMISNNLVGSILCFEEARKNKADVLFLSTSRVYSIPLISQLKYNELKTRFIPDLKHSKLKGISEQGISESFSIQGKRSLYGTTKLCSELLLLELARDYNLRCGINRCSLITGPRQMGKSDQGIIPYWVAAHLYDQPLKFIGYQGKGKQVRDCLDVRDLCRLIDAQLKNWKELNGQIFNVSGGADHSFSLLELTEFCQELTGIRVPIKKDPKPRPNDIPYCVLDSTKARTVFKWAPRKNLTETVTDVYLWIQDNRRILKEFFLP